MSNYIFLPVVSGDMLSLANIIQRFFAGNPAGPIVDILKNNYVSGWKKGAMRKLGKGCLRNLQSQDTLYIVSHGAGKPGSDSIGETRDDGALKKYTQEELAGVLKAEGLPSSFRNVHLLTCGSGLMNKNTIDFSPKAAKILGTNQVRDPKLVKSLRNRKSVARQLCNAMKKNGYKNIQVTGYLGEISLFPPNRVSIKNYFTKQEQDLSWKVVAG